ncbi:MAG: cysteine--tRNA ligase [Patescibacteria group bacterium]|nr:cysteine--tRNA ligase [Patescibacteria group bacterium]
MKITLYNTLSRKKEDFKALKAGKLSFYYCGPTVYWTQHIGNLRGSYCADIIHRTFKYLNYDVSMVRNYTDVGHLVSDEDEGQDKMEKTAQREKMKPEEVANKFIKNYEEDVQALNILDPEFKPRATENISEMIDIVQLLIAKGYAYATDLAIYFEVAKFKNYNKLSGRKPDKNKSGAGQGSVSDPNKKSSSDFALWFFRAGVHKNALQFWPSPFFSPLVENGQGFPGWHIECSAMIRRFLGDSIDIHMGGIEHVSVHHSNEIAQSESATGLKLANYWLHNEHLLVDGAKMAKSQGTSFSLADVVSKGFSALSLRYFFLQAHYRSKQNFTFEALKASQKGLSGILSKIGKLGKELGSVDKDFKDKFLEYLLDDFNVSKTLSLIPEILKSDLSDEDKLATILDFDLVWGLDFKKDLAGAEEKEASNDIEKNLPKDIKKILDERTIARKNKDFVKSDELRLKLERLGYKVQDSSDGKTFLSSI